MLSGIPPNLTKDHLCLQADTGTQGNLIWTINGFVMASQNVLQNRKWPHELLMTLKNNEDIFKMFRLSSGFGI